jgi:hypothetical protein
MGYVSDISHIIRVCYLKEWCDEGIVELRHIRTKYQLTDIGTKALPAPVFLPLRDVILGKVSFSDLQGLWRFLIGTTEIICYDYAIMCFNNNRAHGWDMPVCSLFQKKGGMWERYLLYAWDKG